MASIWYLLFTSMLMVGQYFLEKRSLREGVDAGKLTARRQLQALADAQGSRCVIDRGPETLARHSPEETRMTPMVKADGVSKSFGSNEVLKGDLARGRSRRGLCLVGPSGSGKSTFLRCINHLEHLNAGRLYVDGELVGLPRAGRQALRAAAEGRPRSSAATSAWCSSASTCSRT